MYNNIIITLTIYDADSKATERRPFITSYWQNSRQWRKDKVYDRECHKDKDSASRQVICVVGSTVSISPDDMIKCLSTLLHVILLYGIDVADFREKEELPLDIK